MRGASEVLTSSIRENEPPLVVIEKESWRVLRHWERTQDAEDAALGIVRKTPFGPKLRVCWSLNEAMKEV